MSEATKRSVTSTVVCIGSGPSLNAADCELVKASGLTTIVTNNTWELAPWAAAIYAHDYHWWAVYGQELNFAGARWTASERAAHDFGANWHRSSGNSNSGIGAIRLARDLGARRIVLLGYDVCFLPGDPDCSPHWHGRHPERTTRGERVLQLSNPDQRRFDAWIPRFKLLAGQLRGVEVINCSRVTALTCFPRAPLEQVLT